MATTATPPTPRTRRAPRVSSAATARAADRDGQYDLLTAAIMGIAVGAGITYLLRRGPSGRRPIAPVVSGAGRGIAWAGRNAWKAGSTGASWAGEKGAEAWERVPRDEIRRSMRRGLASARDTIDSAVESELDSLRRSIRRRRKQ